MTPEASLAQAEAARRAQERKRADEEPVKAKLEALATDPRNHIAQAFVRALTGNGA